MLYLKQRPKEKGVPCDFVVYSSYSARRQTPKANSGVAVAHVLSKVLKIESALFSGNRSYANAMFHGSLGSLYHPASLALPK